MLYFNLYFEFLQIEQYSGAPLQLDKGRITRTLNIETLKPKT